MLLLPDRYLLIELENRQKTKGKMVRITDRLSKQMPKEKLLMAQTVSVLVVQLLKVEGHLIKKELAEKRYLLNQSDESAVKIKFFKSNLLVFTAIPDNKY